MIDRDIRVTSGDEALTVLAQALRGAALPARPGLPDLALYHGIGPLLLARTGAEVFRPEARARTMWELRHRHVLAGLLAALSAAGIRCIVMKGTALAYDLYPEAGLRPRGDSDLLIAPQQLAAARAVLRAQGFAAFTEAAAEASQEVWTLTAADGSTHDIDLHWQAFNGPALAGLLPVEEALAEAAPLPRLAAGALALSHVHALLHACIHRAQHILSPYFVAGEAHYGGDRLIWLCDIDLLARALSPQDWARLLDRAGQGGVAPVCHGALADAVRLLGTPVPAEVLARLAALPVGPATEYLLHRGRAGRALADLRATGWRGGARHALARLFPAAALLRSQYPQSRLPLPVLYLRRIGRFLTGGRQ